MDTQKKMDDALAELEVANADAKKRASELQKAFDTFNAAKADIRERVWAFNRARLRAVFHYLREHNLGLCHHRGSSYSSELWHTAPFEQIFALTIERDRTDEQAVGVQYVHHACWQHLANASVTSSHIELSRPATTDEVWAHIRQELDGFANPEVPENSELSRFIEQLGFQPQIIVKWGSRQYDYFQGGEKLDLVG